MKNLIIAIILIFAGLNMVQSQDNVSLRELGVREISGHAGGAVYHMYPSNITPLRPARGYSVVGTPYTIGITWAIGSEFGGTIHYNGNDYEVSSEYADTFSIIVQDAQLGSGIARHTPQGPDIEGVIIDIPPQYIDFARARWTPEGGGQVYYSPDRRYEAAWDGPGLWYIRLAGTRSETFFTSTTAALAWYNCHRTGRTPAVTTNTSGDVTAVTGCN